MNIKTCLTISAFVLLLNLFSFHGSCQDRMIMGYSGIEQDDYTRQKPNKIDYANVAGSPYLKPDFQLGTITIGKKAYSDVQVRFDMSVGTFEFIKNGETYLLSPSVEKTMQVTVTNTTYRPVYLKNGKSSAPIFARVLGSPQFVVVESVTFEPEKKAANQYEKDKPARFSRNKNRIYSVVDNRALIEIKNNKHLLSLLNSRDEELHSSILKLKFHPDNEEWLRNVSTVLDEADRR